MEVLKHDWMVFKIFKAFHLQVPDTSYGSGLMIKRLWDQIPQEFWLFEKKRCLFRLIK